MKVKEVMNQDVRAFSPDANLAEIAAQMWAGDFGIVPIVGARRKVVGMVTDRDICMGASTKNLPPSSIPVHEVMSHEVFGCSPDDPVERALEVMREHGVRRVPVVDAQGAMLGILSLNDLVLAAKAGRAAHPSHDEIVKTMKAICAHREPALAG